MVRFIIQKFGLNIWDKPKFTFQYGQIYYVEIPRVFFLLIVIYIPIWLDLLYIKCKIILRPFPNLHSNMVRFIIQIQKFMELLMRAFTFQYGQIYYLQGNNGVSAVFLIYIPIWLDLLFNNTIADEEKKNDLHSNMVRFIIQIL